LSGRESCLFLFRAGKETRVSSLESSVGETRNNFIRRSFLITPPHGGVIIFIRVLIVNKKPSVLTDLSLLLSHLLSEKLQDGLPLLKALSF